jgi:hypothetical protein
LRIPLNQTEIWDNDVSGCRFEEWMMIWVYQICGTLMTNTICWNNLTLTLHNIVPPCLLFGDLEPILIYVNCNQNQLSKGLCPLIFKFPFLSCDTILMIILLLELFHLRHPHWKQLYVMFVQWNVIMFKIILYLLFHYLLEK